MKKVLILYGRSPWGKEKPFESEMYQGCYEYFYELARKHGLEIFRASYQWYDSKKKFFPQAWAFRNGRWQRTKNIRPDVVHDKTHSRLEVHYFKEQLEKDFPVINDPEFTLLADNKFFTSLIFPQYFKRYYKVNNRKDLQALFRMLKAKRLVLKPALGSGGRGVTILDRAKIASFRFSGPLIAQEFVDSSKGIRGIAKGVHDLRLVFINEKLIYAYVRQPKAGSLLANLAQGGSMFIVEPKKLPRSVAPIIRDVLETFRFYKNKIFTIDLIFDKKQKPWIVELNTMPGMYFSPDQKKWMDKMYLGLVKVLKDHPAKK